MKEKLRTAFLISGSGTTAEAVITKCQKGELKGIEPVIVISNKPQVEGLIRAQKLKIRTDIIQPELFSSPETFGNELLNLLHVNEINLVAQLGWLPLTPLNVVKEYNNRLFNQHSAPLDPGRPDFGGKGMYGLRTHLAVLLYSQLTGIQLPIEATTHQVNQNYDQGEIIRRVPMTILKPNKIMTIEEITNNPTIQKQLLKSAIDIQKKILPIEHNNVILTFQDYVNRIIPVFKRRQPLIPKNCVTFLEKAKKLAIDLLANQKLNANKN